MNKGLLLAFRLAVLAFVLCLSPIVANAQRINLKVENATLESVLDKVEQQSRYLFLNDQVDLSRSCLLYTSPSPRDRQKSRMPSSA